MQFAKRRATGAVVALSLCIAGFGGTAAFAQASPAGSRQPERFEPADSIEGNYLSAVVAGAARDANGAATFLREAIKGDPRNMELLERAFVAFLADGAMNDAFRAAERLVQRDASNGLAQLALGVRAMKNKQYQSARGFLQRGGRGRAADITATLLSAWSFAGAGEFNRAIETVDRLRGESTYNIFRDYHAGLIADASGNVGEATKRLKSSYETERTTVRIVDVWGRFLARRGQNDAAKAVYTEFDGLLPNHPTIKDALDRLKAGQPLQRFATTPQQGGAEVLYGLGSAGNRQGDELAAMIYLRLALHLDAGHEMAILTLGDILERVKQGDDAIAIYGKMPADSPLKTTAELQIGLALETLGKNTEAVAQLTALSAKRPDDTDVLSALGNVHRARKNFPEAAKAYEKALEKIGAPDRSHWNLFYFRGIAYERTKQWSKAEMDFRTALQLIPESLGREKALVLNYLGYSWVDQGLNLDEAFKMLKQAVELRPRDGYIVDSLGWAYYKLGQYDAAARELERAIELKPFDPVINDHLGDAYWKVGRKLEATFQWNHARDLNPEPEDLPKILKKIELGGLPEDKPAQAEVKIEVPALPEVTPDLKPNGG
ncbi:MAG: tetratricopeptide repeat protein [Bosea sp. (in: a-proteobacteria)]